MDDVPTDCILDLVAKVSSLTERILAMQSSIDAMSQKLNDISNIELDLVTIKKDIVLIDHNVQKSHERIDNLSVRVEHLEDKGTTRLKNISEKALLYGLGALGVLIISKIKDIAQLLWGTE